METLFLKTRQYEIYQIDEKSVFDLIKFVVKENYKHHMRDNSTVDIENKIHALYMEELAFSESATAYLARNNIGEIIGSIRVLKWNTEQTLPIHTIFGIDPMEVLPSECPMNYWHVGRFAIDSSSGISTISLFKQLMLCAIDPIVHCDNSYMIAETDSKLLRVMTALGIETWQLGAAVNYLESETIPIYSNNKRLASFYTNYRSLLCRSQTTQKCNNEPQIQQYTLLCNSG